MAAKKLKRRAVQRVQTRHQGVTMARAAVRGDHYANAAGLEPIHAIVAWGWGAAFCAGNVVKYVGRYALKDGERDVGKAAQYLAWLLELMVGPERATAILEPIVAQLKAGGTFPPADDRR